MAKVYVDIVQKTWGELMSKKEVVGKEIYDHILTKEVEMSRLFLNTKLAQQSTVFMSMLDSIIKLADNPPRFEQRLKQLAKSHHTSYGVKIRHYKHFRTAFMRAIKKHIDMTERTEKAWMYVWDKIIFAMSSYGDVGTLLDSEESKENYAKYLRELHVSFKTVTDVDAKLISERFYQNLLKEQPDIAKLFDTNQIELQGVKFIAMLSHAINLLDDKATFLEGMLQLGKKHKAYGVKLTQLKAFGETFTNMIRQHYKDWNDTSEAAWKWFWNAVVLLFSKSLHDDSNLVNTDNNNNNNNNNNNDTQNNQNINHNSNNNNQINANAGGGGGGAGVLQRPVFDSTQPIEETEPQVPARLAQK